MSNSEKRLRTRDEDNTDSRVYARWIRNGAPVSGRPLPDSVNEGALSYYRNFTGDSWTNVQAPVVFQLEFSFGNNNIYIPRTILTTNNGRNVYIPDIYINFSGSNTALAYDLIAENFVNSILWDSVHFDPGTGSYISRGFGGSLKNFYDKENKLAIDFGDFAGSHSEFGDGVIAVESTSSFGSSLIKVDVQRFDSHIQERKNLVNQVLYQFRIPGNSGDTILIRYSVTFSLLLLQRHATPCPYRRSGSPTSCHPARQPAASELRCQFTKCTNGHCSNTARIPRLVIPGIPLAQ